MSVDSRQRRPGQPLRIPAADFNAMMAGSKKTEAMLRSAKNGSGENAFARGIVKVLNCYDRPLEPFELVQCSYPFSVIGEDGQGSFLDVVNFRAEPVGANISQMVWNGYDATYFNSAVVLDGIPPGGVGNAIMDGITQCKSEGIFGTPDESNSYIYWDQNQDPPVPRAGKSGPIEILWFPQVGGSASMDYLVIRLGGGIKPTEAALIQVSGPANAPFNIEGYWTVPYGCVVRFPLSSANETGLAWNCRGGNRTILDEYFIGHKLRQIPGAANVTVSVYGGATNQQQTVNFSSPPSGGDITNGNGTITFPTANGTEYRLQFTNANVTASTSTLTLGGETAASIKSALEALPNIGSVAVQDVTVWLLELWGAANYTLSVTANGTTSNASFPANATAGDVRDDLADLPNVGSGKVDIFISPPDNYFRRFRIVFSQLLGNVTMSASSAFDPQPVLTELHNDYKYTVKFLDSTANYSLLEVVGDLGAQNVWIFEDDGGGGSPANLTVPGILTTGPQNIPWGRKVFSGNASNGGIGIAEANGSEVGAIYSHNSTTMKVAAGNGSITIGDDGVRVSTFKIGANNAFSGNISGIEFNNGLAAGSGNLGLDPVDWGMSPPQTVKEALDFLLLLINTHTHP